MQFSGEGYIVKVRSHGEKSAIVTLVCPKYGKIVGYIEGALKKRSVGIYQLGNYISFNAYARLEGHMPSLKGVELVRAHVADFMCDEKKTDALLSMSRLIDECLAEHDDLGEFYTTIDAFFQHIGDKLAVGSTGRMHADNPLGFFLTFLIGGFFLDFFLIPI